MKRARLVVVLVLVLTAALVASGAALAAGPSDVEKLRRAVTVDGILKHENKFQSIANNNGGTRASGTPGYDRSKDYVIKKLRGAGYKVTVQPFEFSLFTENAPSEFERTQPTPRTYVGDDPNTDANEAEFTTMEYSGSGDVTAPVTPVDVVLPPSPTPSSSSGCEASDFAGFPAGDVALVQRGTCTFGTKAQNAQDAGASAVVIFNEGQAGRTEVLNGTLGGPGYDIPVIGTTFEVGNDLATADAAPGGATVRVFTDTRVDTRTTSNVIANTKAGNPNKAIVVGAHLDSVAEGAGINDNGSGTSSNLEMALQMAKTGYEPRNQIRFAFWGAEESGLLGSEYYVGQLSDEQLKNISANLNFDMVGSPNYVRFVYDGDGSDTPDTGAGPEGSAKIEKIFNNYFADRDKATDPTAFDGRSDYGPFIAVGIPAGGLFSGAEGIKTPEQAAEYGGTPGVAYDSCYHQACDDIDNLNRKALSELSDAAAHATVVLGNLSTRVGKLTVQPQSTDDEDLPVYKGPHPQK